MATQAELNQIEDTAAREAVRIADKFLPFASVERRKVLANEIVAAINLCEREFGAEIIRRAAAKGAK